MPLRHIQHQEERPRNKETVQSGGEEGHGRGVERARKARRRSQREGRQRGGRREGQKRRAERRVEERSQREVHDKGAEETG